jgi:hypothetical protein
VRWASGKECVAREARASSSGEKHEAAVTASFEGWGVSLMQFDFQRTDDELRSNNSAEAVLG